MFISPRQYKAIVFITWQFEPIELYFSDPRLSVDHVSHYTNQSTSNPALRRKVGFSAISVTDPGLRFLNRYPNKIISIFHKKYIIVDMFE